MAFRFEEKIKLNLKKKFLFKEWLNSQKSYKIYPDREVYSIYFDNNSLFPRDTKSISYATLRKIRTNISEALPYYVFEDETTSAHLRSMINKIDSILDAQVMLR